MQKFLVYLAFNEIVFVGNILNIFNLLSAECRPRPRGYKLHSVAFVCRGNFPKKLIALHFPFFQPLIKIFFFYDEKASLVITKRSEFVTNYRTKQNVGGYKLGRSPRSWPQF